MTPLSHKAEEFKEHFVKNVITDAEWVHGQNGFIFICNQQNKFYL